MSGFRGEILAGEQLIPTGMKSVNYVTGVSGWRIGKNGDAEFNGNVLVGGDFRTGTTGSRVEISDSPLPPFGGIARIVLYSADPQEIGPAVLSNFQNAGVSWLELDTSDDGFGINQLIGLAPQGTNTTLSGGSNTAGAVFITTVAAIPAGSVVRLDAGALAETVTTNGPPVGAGPFVSPLSSALLFSHAAGAAAVYSSDSGGWLFATTYAGAQIGLVVLDGDMQFLSRNQSFMNSLAFTSHPFQIGLTGGVNLRMDKQIIQGMNAGAASTLFLQYLGGDVQLGNTAPGDLVIGNGFVVSTQMRAAAGADAANRTTSSVPYVVAASTCNCSIPVPSSGVIKVSIGSRLSNNGAGTDATGVSFNVRNGNAAGAILVAGTDIRGAFMTAVCAAGTQPSVSRTVVVAPGAAASGVYYVEAVIRVNNAATVGSAVQTTLAVEASA